MTKASSNGLLSVDSVSSVLDIINDMIKEIQSDAAVETIYVVGKLVSLNLLKNRLEQMAPKA